jgi:hypothetical protein
MSPLDLGNFFFVVLTFLLAALAFVAISNRKLRNLIGVGFILIGVVAAVVIGVISVMSVRQMPPSISTDKAVRNYYRLINERKYEESWSMLSAKFRDARLRDTKGQYTFTYYQRYWNCVSKAVILESNTKKPMKANALVVVDMLYRLKEGGELYFRDYNIYLAYDEKNNGWLIDGTKVDEVTGSSECIANVERVW